MGCNYYHIEDPCPTCGHGKETHIGKSSVGWAFGLHVDDEHRNLDDWKRVLPIGVIKDEYGQIISYNDMIDIITKRKHPNGLRHDDKYCVGYGDTWDLIEGEFS